MTNQTQPIVNPTWLSTPQVAVYLGLSEQAIRELVFKQKLPMYQVGRLWRFKLTDVEDFIERSRYSPESSHPSEGESES